MIFRLPRSLLFVAVLERSESVAAWSLRSNAATPI
jgi:hypothetical protein